MSWLCQYVHVLILLTVFIKKTLEEYYQNEPSSEIPTEQILMTDQAKKYNAICNDGSVADFYYRAGTGDGINKFHLYLQGGM